MLPIENVAKYVGYDEIIAEYSRAKLEKRYETLYKSAETFITEMGYTDVTIDEYALLYAMFDYFADISRLKLFHKINLVNEVKVTSYEVYWILKRKPLQVAQSSKENVFVNERFVLSIILNCLSNEGNIPFSGLGSDELTFFTEPLFYFLKFRPFDAQAIEMIILAFLAGRTCSEVRKTSQEK